MRVLEQAPCLRAFCEELKRPASLVGPVRPQLRFFGASFSTGVSVVEEVFICFDFAQRGVRG